MRLLGIKLTDDGLEADKLFALPDRLNLADKLLQLLHPVCDESSLLLQVHALVSERTLML